MKKVVYLLIALVLCFSISAVALRMLTPSKVISDMVEFEGEAEDLIISTGIGSNNTQAEAFVELAKLRAVDDMKSYFGDVEFADGTPVSYDGLTVSEFNSFCVSGYKTSMGDVTVKMRFPTPYQEGEKVVVMIGIVEANARGGQDVEWVAFNGVGIGDSMGRIEVTIAGETLLAAQEGTAVIAILNK